MSDTDPNQTASAAGQTQPGWYPDPTSGQLRWWDGQQWGQFQETGATPAPAQAPIGGTATGGSDPKTMAMLAHLLGALMGFVGPLIIYATQGNNDPFVKDQSTEALNFQLTMLIGYIVSGVLMIVLIGLLIFPIVWLASIAFGIIGAMAANKGEWYRYPFSIKFIKAA